MKYALWLIPSCMFLSCTSPVSSSSVLEEMEFVNIPSGSFEMGSPVDEEGRYPDEGPVHTVTIDYGFEILSTEVTQSMWEGIMGDNPSSFSGEERPVESVSWDDCQEFISRLNSIDPDHIYRLPSESEWEYACRGGTASRFYSGNEQEALDNIGWYSGNSGSTTENVGQLEHNPWGLYDMSGNVWEWCQDYYHEDYSGAPDDGSPWLDNPGSSRVSRGGSIGSASRRCRSAARDECYQGFRYHFLGFRVVRMWVQNM